MKNLLLIGLLAFAVQFPVASQNLQVTNGTAQRISRDNLAIRPNSREYNIIRKGNNHQRVIQMRAQAMLRHKQAMLNRKVAMDRRRVVQQQKLMKQQQIRQRMIRQRDMHR